MNTFKLLGQQKWKLISLHIFKNYSYHNLRNIRHSSIMIAVAQMRCTNNKDKNYECFQELVKSAAEKNAKIIFFPEVCDYIGESKKETLHMAEPFMGPTLVKYCNLAKSFNIWLSVGGIHIKNEGMEKISNTHFIIDNNGSIIGRYAKTHLFNVNIAEKNINLQESKLVFEGKNIAVPVLSPCGLIAMGICYDMRFPEFSLLQRRAGAQILTFPSAFTVHTGSAHWHALLRARAIETQCYVVAAAQEGYHNKKRSSYGHSLIIDPWGKVMAEVTNGEKLAFAEIDLNYLEKIRAEMPVLTHRRKDLYSLHSMPISSEPRITELKSFPHDYVTYKFGQVSVPGNCVFLQTSFSHAFVNKKPFTDGHVLISPYEAVERFHELREGVVSDLGQAVIIAHRVLVQKYNPGSVHFAIQDGPSAGQTIKHVHVHLIPVIEGDDGFVENHELRGARDWRSTEDMAEEAADLRHYVVEVDKNTYWLSSAGLQVPRPLKLKKTDEREAFKVEELSVSVEDVFLYTEHCFAFLVGNPILNGHTCVCLLGKDSTFGDLSPEKVSDLFLSLQKVQKCLEDWYSVSSTTIYMECATTSKNIHVHIVPRNEDDLKDNDDIYKILKNYNLSSPNDEEKLITKKLRDIIGRLK